MRLYRGVLSLGTILLAAGCSGKHPLASFFTGQASGSAAVSTAGSVPAPVAIASQTPIGLSGVVRGPSDAVLSNNGSSIIGGNVAGLIANNAGSLIGNNAAGLVGNHAAGYHLTYQDADLVPLPGVPVQLATMGGRVLSKAVTTASDGSFRFDPAALAGYQGPVVVLAFTQRAGRDVQLQTVTLPGSGKQLVLDPATTLASRKVVQLVASGKLAIEAVQATTVDQLAATLAPVLNDRGAAAAVLLGPEGAVKVFDAVAANPSVSASITTAVPVSIAPTAPDPRPAAPPPTVNMVMRIGGQAGLDASHMPASRAAVGTLLGGVAVSPSGNVYVADTSKYRVLEVLPAGDVVVVAGTGASGSSGDGGPASAAQLGGPYGLAFDAAGNLYIADSLANRIRKVDAAGTITTVAGGAPGFTAAGNGGPATLATVPVPHAVAFDAQQAMYLVDDSGVRKVGGDGIITQVAGGGISPPADGASALDVTFDSLYGLAFDHRGNLYVSDNNGHRVWRIDAMGTLHAFAGTGTSGYGGDGGSALNAQLQKPFGLAMDPGDNLYVADYSNERIRRIDPAGTITTYGGTGSVGFGPAGPATSSSIATPYALAFAPNGHLFTVSASFPWLGELGTGPLLNSCAPFGAAPGETIALEGAGFSTTPSQNAVAIGGATATVKSASPTELTVVVPASNDGTGARVTVGGLASSHAYFQTLDRSQHAYAGSASPPSGNGDGGDALGGSFLSARSLALDAVGDLFFAEVTQPSGVPTKIREISASTHVITTYAGQDVAGDVGDGTSDLLAARFNAITGIGFDLLGHMLIADCNNDRVRQIAAGALSTVAGVGATSTGDGGPAASAGFGGLNDLTGARLQGYYVVDNGTGSVRHVDASGVIHAFAGNGTPGFSGDGGPATQAQLAAYAGGLAADTHGNLFIADRGNRRVRKVDSHGTITTYAGNGLAGATGDGGPAQQAAIGTPYALAVDAAGNLYVADSDNGLVRRVAPDGTITLVAGGSARFTGPSGLAVGPDGAVYVADFNKIWVVGVPAS